MNSDIHYINEYLQMQLEASSSEQDQGDRRDHEDSGNLDNDNDGGEDGGGDEAVIMALTPQQGKMSKIRALAQMQQESIGCYRADMMALFNGEYVPHDVELVFRGDDTSVATEESGTAQSQRSIPAHRLILSARCPRLSRILLQDAQITKINVDELTSPHKFNFDIIRCVVVYLYTGALDLSAENVFDVFELSSIWELVHVQQICSMFLQMSTDATSVVALLLSALKRKDTKFVELCMRAIQRNTMEVITSDIFTKLPRDVIIQILQDDDINVVEEIHLYKAVLRWHAANPDQNLQDILQYVRFPQMNDTELAKLERHGSVPVDLLLEAYRFIACSAVKEEELSSQLILYPEAYSIRCKPRRLQQPCIMWRLDPNNKSPMLTVSNNSLTVEHNTTSGHASIIGNRSFTRGLHVFRFRIDGTSHWVGIGVIDRSKVTSTFTSDYSFFYGASSASQLYKVNGPISAWNTGDIIRVTLNLDKRVVRIQVEGGTTDLTGSITEPVGTKFTPIINLYSPNNKVTVLRGYGGSAPRPEQTNES